MKRKTHGDLGQLWALCHETALCLKKKNNNDDDDGGGQLVTPTHILLSTSGLALRSSSSLNKKAPLDATGGGPSSDNSADNSADADCDSARFRPEHGRADVFSLGATLFYAADYLLGPNEEPCLSHELELLLGSMTESFQKDPLQFINLFCFPPTIFLVTTY